MRKPPGFAKGYAEARATTFEELLEEVSKLLEAYSRSILPDSPRGRYVPCD